MNIQELLLHEASLYYTNAPDWYYKGSGDVMNLLDHWDERHWLLSSNDYAVFVLLVREAIKEYHDLALSS